MNKTERGRCKDVKRRRNQRDGLYTSIFVKADTDPKLPWNPRRVSVQRAIFGGIATKSGYTLLGSVSSSMSRRPSYSDTFDLPFQRRVELRHSEARAAMKKSDLNML